MARPAAPRPAPLQPPARSPLTPDELREIAGGSLRAVMRAATFATISAWTLAIGAVLTALFAVCAEPSTLIGAAIMAGLTWNEFRGAAALRRLDPRGPGRLALNQVLLGVLLVGYGGWRLLTSSGAVQSVFTQIPVTDAESIENMQNVARIAVVAVYAGVMAAGVLGPGLTAWYYLSRGPVLRRAREQTPPWVLDIVRAVR